MIRKALYAGTFDPFTLGHLNIVERSARLFDALIIGIATNGRKSPLFSIATRFDMVKQAVAHLNNVMVMELTGLTAHFAKQQHAHYLVRGIRSTADYDYESTVASVNWELSSGELETIFMPTHPEFACLSSSVVRDLITHQAFDVLERFLPITILKKITKKPEQTGS